MEMNSDEPLAWTPMLFCWISASFVLFGCQEREGGILGAEPLTLFHLLLVVILATAYGETEI